MKIKERYAAPQVEILEMHYAERVCQAISGEGIPDYDYNPLNPGDLFGPSF